MKIRILASAGAATILLWSTAAQAQGGYRVCGPLGNPPGIPVCFGDTANPAIAAYPSVYIGLNAGALNGLTNTTAIGPSAFVSGNTATALGANSIASATGSLALGANSISSGVNSVAIGQGSDDSGRANVFSVGSAPSVLQPGGITRTIINVSAGTAATDAANVAQLTAAFNSAVTTSQAYTDQRFNTLSGQMNSFAGQLGDLSSRVTKVARDANAGTASAIASSNIPQATAGGRTTFGGAVGTWNGQSSFAIGASHMFEGTRLAVRGSANFDSRGSTGGGVGFGVSF